MKRYTDHSKNYIDEKLDIVKRLKSLHVKWSKQVKR